MTRGAPSPALLRSCGASAARPLPRGEARILRALALTILSLSALACGRAHDDTVIPSRSDLARQSRRTLPGKTYENREKIRQGMKQADLTAAVGAPSEKLESRGQVVSGHWTYLYSDGKIVVNLRDGVVTEIETTFY